MNIHHKVTQTVSISGRKQSTRRVREGRSGQNSAEGNKRNPTKRVRDVNSEEKQTGQKGEAEVNDASIPTTFLSIR